MNAPSPSALDEASLAAILADLSATGPGSAQDSSGRGRGHVWVEVAAEAAPGSIELSPDALELSAEGVFLLGLRGTPSERELAAWRNALWPGIHVFALYSNGEGGARRRTLQGKTKLDFALEFDGTILAGRRTEHVMSPSATVEKFDQNAKGWDGEPGRPGYGHFRWMRRYVSLFGAPKSARRILDFGCGAGWVGIEAALARPGATLSAFDPSPEMVRITESNARAAGIADFTGRTGFGEDPPFPADGEEPYDWVLSSGVLSFSPDLERWVDGVAGAVASKGTLIVGDIHRDSRGFRRRRTEKALLPVRELNARTREEIVPMLEARGFRYLRSSGYQLTRPVPEAMHVSETRLKGALSMPLLWMNQLAAFADRKLGSRAPGQFDSWVAQLVRES